MTEIVARPVRSFVLRQGRMSPGQARALTDAWPAYGIDYAPALIDFASAFGRRAPVVLEIGFGMGETTAQIAAAQPQCDFVGIEVHGPGVGAMLARIEALGLRNVRVIRHDAVEVVAHMIPLAALAGLHVFFPDPWPKKRHHKRRLLQPAFISLIATKLVPGGVVHLATDWPEYAEQMAALSEASACFASSDAALITRPATKFEQRGRRLGNPVRDL